MAQYPEVLEIPEWIAMDGARAAKAGRMIDFHTGKSELRQSHRLWLEQRVVPAILQHSNPWIDMYGYASKVGDQAKNLALSRSRCDSVKSFLRGSLANKGRSISGMVNINVGMGEDDPMYYGESFDNSPYWRAVELVVFGSKPQGRRPPHAPPLKRKPATDFQIRTLGGLSGGFGLQADVYFFQIDDLTRRLSGVFQLGAGGLQIPVPALPPLSVALKGPATKFHTNQDARLFQFNTRVSLNVSPGASVILGVGGNMHLTFGRIDDNISGGFIFVRPSPIEIEPGGGVGFGSGSATEGVLALLTTGPYFES